MATTQPRSAVEGAAPSDEDLRDQLGASHVAFRTLTQERSGAMCAWKRYSKKGPWVMKVSEGTRTLYYLVPHDGRFEVTVVLGERATDAALAGRVRPELHEAIRSAKAYVEGRSVTVPVSSAEDLAAVEELVAVKLKPQLD